MSVKSVPREMWTVHTPSAVPAVGPLKDISMSPAWEITHQAGILAGKAAQP